jgi:hypothetical protein
MLGTEASVWKWGCGQRKETEVLTQQEDITPMIPATKVIIAKTDRLMYNGVDFETGLQNV